MLYAIAYRFDSNSATHATPFAAEQFVEARGDNIVVHSEPQGPRPDPYVVLAMSDCFVNGWNDSDPPRLHRPTTNESAELRLRGTRCLGLT